MIYTPKFYWSVVSFMFMFFFLSSCESNKNQQNGFRVSVDIRGLENGEAKLVKWDLQTNEKVNVDSVPIKNGKFFFEGTVCCPYMHTILINKQQTKIHFFLENSKITIQGDVNDLEHVMVSGSKEDSLFRRYTLGDIYNRKKGLEVMLNYPQYNAAAMLAYYQLQYHSYTSDTLQLIVDQFNSQLDNSVYLPYLNKIYHSIKNVAIGEQAPDFEMPDTSGQKVRLSDFKGKYALIDFWASWCVPCRASNKTLVKAYQMFAKRTFTIVGISVDKNKRPWLEAIKKDKLVWTNLSNLQGWDEITNAYAVKAVPQNLLINPKGIIIAKNIREEDLIQKLNAILPEM